MASLLGRFVAIDSFGEAVSINYRGDSTFKTGVGAFFTLCLRVFILYYGVAQFIDVTQYKDP